jgi:hypothetical protein
MTGNNVGSIHHRVWRDGEVIDQFLGVDWYDKPMSYYDCLKHLQQLQVLSVRNSFIIESFGAQYPINSPSDFCQWLHQVFEGGVSHGFSGRICSAAGQNQMT